MTNQQIENAGRKGWNVGRKVVEVAVKAYRIARVSFVVTVVLLSLVGLYTVSQAELRNQVIDYAQGVDAPKAN